MQNNLKDKNIVLCVCGGIAAYKTIDVLRQLQKKGANVRVVMTRSALSFVGEMTFNALSGYPVLTNLWNGEDESSIRHIDWAEQADAVIIAPATANIIGKYANGIADDAMTTFLLAVTTPILVCPSMNTNMYENRAVQKNLDTLEGYGCHIVEPGTGDLACGVTGAGRLPEPEIIVDRLEKALAGNDLSGKKVLLSAGPTQEAIDPVRYISNHSSGKMGYAIARAAEYRGAEVVLVTGPSSQKVPVNVKTHKVTSAEEMAKAVFDEMNDADIIIKVAAVADYKPKEQAEHKIKKNDDEMVIKLEKNPDILKEVGARKNGQVVVGFAAETQDLSQNAGKKLEAKNLDMIVGNLVGDPSSGFGTDTNKVTFFFRDGRNESLESMEKDAVANILLDRIVEEIKGRINA